MSDSNPLSSFVSNDILFLIFTHIPLSTLTDPSRRISKAFESLFRHWILNRSFFAERERKEFRDVLYGPKVHGQQAPCLRNMNMGFPQLYYELLHFQRIAGDEGRLEVIGANAKDFWQQLEPLTHLGDHLDIAYESYSKNLFDFAFPNELIIHESLYASDWNFVKESIEECSIVLHNAPEHIKSDPILAKMVIKKHQMYGLEAVSASFRSNNEFMRQYIDMSPHILNVAGDELLENKSFILEAVREYGSALEYAPSQWKADREIVLAAVQDDPYALKFVDASLQDDEDVVLAAVQKDGLMVKYASERLKRDRRIVAAAVKHNKYALQFADQSLRSDPEFAQ